MNRQSSEKIEENAACESTLVVGASSALAQSYIEQIAQNHPGQKIVALSRQSVPAALKKLVPNIEWRQTSYEQTSLRLQLDASITQNHPLRRVAIFNGVLHDHTTQPEKRLEDIDPDQIASIFQVNTVLPLLILQAVFPHLSRKQKCTLAVLSARVGSITDNRLGGWYSYRASKAGLNMLLKTASIEMARRYPESKLIAFHPGTFDSPLSKPFQRGVPEHKLFTPVFVAERLIHIMDSASRDSQLSYLDWDNQKIDW